MTELALRLAAVHQEIEAAASRAKRDPAEVTLIAVSKRKPAADVVSAYEAGARHFGENYVQELVDKAPQVGPRPELVWHYIGHLQRNKANALLAVEGLGLVHGVDGSKLLRALDKRTTSPLGVLLQVNLAGEASKSGCTPEALGELVAEARACEHLELRGLMTMPPPVDDPEDVRPFFRQLRELRERHDAGPELSMGMSSDFGVAIEEGATIVRVGTAIFGARA